MTGNKGFLTGTRLDAIVGTGEQVDQNVLSLMSGNHGRSAGPVVGEEEDKVESASPLLPLTTSLRVPKEGAGILCYRAARAPARNLKKAEEESR